MAHRRQFQGNEQRGSVLVGGLVLTLVMTLLGLALFNLSTLESRLVLGTEADYRAFETAQAGIERALYRLFRDYCGTDDCLSTASENWADGNINGISAGPDTTAFYPFDLTGTGIVCITTPCGDGNKYSVKLKNVTKAEAASLSIVCADDPCKDVIYVRSTGDFTKGVVESGSRTIQLIARAAMVSPFGAGLIGGAPSGATIDGNALIAGSLHVAGCAAPPCVETPVALIGAAGVRNNYNAMPPELQDRVPPLDVVCPSGNCVESLSSYIRIARPQSTPALNLSGTATLGTSSAATNPYTGRVGRAIVENALIGDGCDPNSNPYCSDAVGGNQGAQNIFSDNAQKVDAYDLIPCDPSDPISICFPMLSQETTIKNITYSKYADCPSEGNCNSGLAGNGTGEFFISHAFKILAGTMTDGGVDLFNLLTTSSGLTNMTPDFQKTFECGVDAVCDDSNGARVNGSINSSKPSHFKLSWTDTTDTLTIYQCTSPPSCPTGPDFTNWSVLSHTTAKVLPILVYVDGDLNICKGCNNREFLYQGQAMFLAKGKISIDPNLLTLCTNNILAPIACNATLNTTPADHSDHDLDVNDDHRSFPKKNLLTFLTPGDMDIGLTSNRDMIGIFYAGDTWKTTKQTNVVGAVTARIFDMGNQVPKFFQVPQLTNLLPETLFPPRQLKWKVATARWKECKGTVPGGPC